MLTPKLIEVAHRYGEAKMAFKLALDEHRAANGLVALASAGGAVGAQLPASQVVVAAPKDAPPPAPEKTKFCECGIAFRKGQPCPFPGSAVRNQRTKIIPEEGAKPKMRTLSEACYKEWEKQHKPKKGPTIQGVRKKKQKTLQIEQDGEGNHKIAVVAEEQEGEIEEVVDQFEEEEEEEQDNPKTTMTMMEVDDDDDELVMEPE